MPGLEDASREELLALVVEQARMIEQLRAEVAELRRQGLRVIEVWDSPEHIERFMDSGLAQAISPKRCRRRRFPSRRSPSSRSTSSTGFGADYGPRWRAQAVRGWGINGPGRTDSMWSTPSRVSTLRTG